jgi:hypothetical protein
MKSFFQLRAEAKQLTHKSADHELLGFDSKAAMTDHLKKIASHHGDQTAQRHARQMKDRANTNREKLQHELPTHRLKVTLINNFRKIPAGTELTRHRNRENFYAIRSGEHKGTQIKARDHQVEKIAENFKDGRNPQDRGDSARHGLKGKSAAELRSIRSSDTASPRKKQLAHWLLNFHHNKK